MTRRPAGPPRLFLILAATVLLAAAAALPAAAAEEPEIIKGTVRSCEAGVLVLANVRFQDVTIPPRDVRILIDKATSYYDGPIQVTKEAIVPDLIVLVRCTLAGSDRKALLVRIIGGKKPE